MWVRENDLVLVAPWDFNVDKADIMRRYINSNEEILGQQGIIPKRVLMLFYNTLP
jgi:translation initiation factor 1A